MLMHQNLQGRLVITPFTGCLMPHVIAYLYNAHKMAMVSIADHSHFNLPLWRSRT